MHEQGFAGDMNGQGVAISGDLDDFKRVIDTMGHAAGDDSLQIISGRMKTAKSSKDFVARIGGDEFVFCARLSKETAGFWANEYGKSH